MSHLTLNAEQLACLASPARNEVFMQLRTLGQGSIGDIARAIGRKPEAVHYHVKALVAAGLASQAYRRHSTKKPEAVFAPIGKEVRLPKGPQEPEVAALMRKAVAAGFRQTARGYLAASKAAESDSETRRWMHVIRLNARLSPEDAQEFISRIEAAVRFADQHRNDEGIKLIWSSVTYPARKRP
jgi:DNA-binding transcriptional ArsR family regulator